MEQAFVTLTQGTKSVREYEAEFIRLQKYVNYGYGDDGVMVRKFLQGLTPEIGGRLQAVTYTHLYDLIEKAVNVESFIKREKAMANRSRDNRSQGSGSNPRHVSTTKKTYPTTQGERPRTENMSRGDGACFVCGSKGHFARTCPEKRENGMAVTTQYQPTCYYCGVKGHFSNNCPAKTNVAPGPADRPPAATRSANEAPNKRRTPAERVYVMGAEIGEHRDQSGGPITGTLRVGGNPTHVLFDSGATHSFVTPEIFKVNLLVVPMVGYEVILGMDWLSIHMTYLDCRRGRVILEEGHGNSTIYQGIRPSNGVSLVSAMRVRQHLIEGSAYLVAISVVEEKISSEEKIEEIPVVSGFEDVFKSLTELPPPRSNPFTINLIPGAAPIAKTPYRMAPAELAELKAQLEDLLDKGFKRSYSQKSEGCSRRPYRESAPNAQSGWPRNDVPRSAKTVFRPTEVSAKVQTTGRSHNDPGNIVPRSAKFQRHATPRTTKRASRETKPRGRATRSRTTADASVRAGEERPTSGRETIGQISSARPSRPTVKSSGPTVPTRPRPDCPADRPDRPSERRGRPEAVFEAQSAQFKPKAGADLARLGLAASSYLEHYKYFFLAL
ncbi:unnamed protein product [Microthlaspi erraticum]|uniref:CCHC-type domain-containing protein n=1 Tax=Microthlaspi erraticum TaxID=1685480 RepID=A0A6D2L0Q2_9BRAS|nr:unnamed protein product [Microthlaspi erraticum]